jgi:photosystem II stability/assembly factor-like uncharacterized protein
LSVFSTADGGRTWSRSAPVTAAVRGDQYIELRLDFIDPQHGWLMVLDGPDGLLYSTSNGGRDWAEVSGVSGSFDSFCVMKFLSLTTGYMGSCRNVESPTASLTFTRDGGKTWNVAGLPQPFGVSFIVDAPVFFDAKRAVVSVIATVGQNGGISYLDYLAATSDGGASWHALPAVPPGFAVAYQFEDPSRFWVLRSDGNGGPDTLYRTTNAAVKWTRVASNLPPIYWGTVVFVDAQHGFVIDTNSAIGQGPHDLTVTADGGRTWRTIHPKLIPAATSGQ